MNTLRQKHRLLVRRRGGGVTATAFSPLSSFAAPSSLRRRILAGDKCFLSTMGSGLNFGHGTGGARFVAPSRPWCVGACHPAASSRGRFTRDADGGGRRHMSDNLLGYSPMANPVPKSPQPSSSADNKDGDAQTKPKPPPPPAFGVDSNTAGGGVWAQTSAKRDKLGELRLELKDGQRTLDDAATPEQTLDLNFADGLKLIAKSVDEAWDVRPSSMASAAAETDSAGAEAGETPPARAALAELEMFLASTERSSSLNDGDGEGSSEDEAMHRRRFEAHLDEAIRIVSTGLPSSSTTAGGSGDAAADGEMAGQVSPFTLVRDFVLERDDDDKDGGNSGADSGKETGEEVETTQDDNGDAEDAALLEQSQSTIDAFDDCVSIYRALLVKAAAESLKSKWDDLVAVTDADVDRAAVKNEPIDPPDTVSLRRVNDVLRSCAKGTAADRTESMWKLIDRDGDGLLDQEEMDRVALMSLKSVEGALKELAREAADAWPVRAPLPSLGGGETDEEGATRGKTGWRQRRREAKAKKRLIKLFDGAASHHFDVEVETPHRLRCIYAWADKAHQNNKVDSVLVDASTDWGSASNVIGRKRYVELHPKISYDEFVQEQREHFAHLDRAGEEMVSSFREDLLVDQGKGRQNRELRRDCFLFLAAVSLIDVGINAI